jgi:hypothetical protein
MTQRERPAPGYLLGADESERTRLLAQGEIYRAETEALFDRIEIPPGGRAVDFGCGPLGVLDLLSRRATELEEYLSAPGTFVIHPLLFQVWGRKAG